MQLAHPENVPVDDVFFADGEQWSRTALRQQLDRMLESRHFRNSKRYPLFLRFVVEHTLAGELTTLKERTLGIDVFGRASDYDTNADPVVRVTAGEIRKRIAQYYQDVEHQHEIRIYLPLGHYVPRFCGPETLLPPAPDAALDQPIADTGGTHHEPEVLPVPEARAVSSLLGTTGTAVSAQTPVHWIVRNLAVGGVLLVFLVFAVRATGLFSAGSAEQGPDAIWAPVLSAQTPLTIVIGEHSFDRQGNEKRVADQTRTHDAASADMLDTMVRSDMVPLSDIISYSRLTNLLTRHNRAFQTVGASEATLEEIRKGPLVLVGGLDNLWTIRLTSRLRFRFEAADLSESQIVDTLHPETRWRFNNLQNAVNNTRDYAIVASYFDQTIEQQVLIVAGIGATGTLVASEFATDTRSLQQSFTFPRSGAKKNFELVLSTEILDGKAGPPHVIASETW